MADTSKKLKKLGLPSKDKAKKMLEEHKKGDKKLTDKQLALFRMIASGKVPTRLNDVPSELRKGLGKSREKAA